MRTYNFYQLDVFTKKTFCGNPLAVFPEAEGLTGEEMQKIAREMNLSETVFVLPSEKALRKLRIFTPMQELPLAGHPVVGTWNLLARLGITPQIEKGFIEIMQELKLGILPVEIEFRDEKPFRVTMTQGKFETGGLISDTAEIEQLAVSLGLEMSDLNLQEELPIQVVSTGIKALAVPVSTLDALSRCRINSQLLSEIYLAHDAIGCYAFTFETIDKTSKIHARFFAPDDNIPEDPATGSAAGSLSGYLVYHGAFKKFGKASLSECKDEGLLNCKFTIEQGDFMKRPSRIFAEIIGEEGKVETVRIGGSSIVAAKGEIYL